MNNNLKKTGWALFVALTLFACKKDQKQVAFADDAKNWYLKNNRQTSYALASSRNETLKISQQADWNNAQTVQLKDGTEVLGVPLSLKLADGKAPQGSYMLMISKEKGSFKKLIAYNKEKEFFNYISNDKVEGAFNLSNHLLQLQKRANNNPGRGKVMSEENGGGEGDQPVCTDWYLIETYRDADGNIIEVVETFLFQSCTGGPSSPGSGGNDDGGTEEIDWGLSESTLGSISQTDTSAVPVVFDKTFTWQVYSAPGGVKFTSTDKVYSRKASNVWLMIESLEHTSIQNAGATSHKGWTVEPVFVSFSDFSNQFKAKCNLKFKDKRSRERNGNYLEREKQYEANGDWSIADLKLQ